MRAKQQNIIATYATRLVILAVLLHVLLLLTAQQWAVVFPMAGSSSKNCQPATPRNCSGGVADAACPLPWVGEPAALNPLDCTPQLLILGAMRAGTTAAASYLNNSFHPAIAGISSQPGLQFFTQDRAELSGDALDAYLTSFPGVDASDNPLWGQCSYVRQQVAAANTTTSSSSSSSGSSSQQPSLLVRYEAGASYLAHPRAAGNVKAILPQVRLLTLLREPLSRTLSHLHAEAQWRGSLSDDSEALRVGPTNYTKLLTQSMSPRLEKLLRFVAQLLQREMDVVRGCYNQYRPSMGPLFQQMDACVAESMISNGFSRSSHIYQSLYGIHLERWFSIGSASQMLIWSASDFELAPLDHLTQLVGWLGLDGSGINTRQRFCAVDKRSADIISLLPPELIAQVARFYEPFNQLLFRVLRDNGFGLLADRLSSQWRNPVQQWLDSYDSSPSTSVPLAALFAPELSEEELQQEGGQQQAAGADQAADAAKKPRAVAAGSSRSDAAVIGQGQPAPIKVQLAAQQQLLVNCAQLAATATQAVANVQLQTPNQLVISCTQLNAAGEEVAAAATQQGRNAASLRMSTLGAADAPKLGGLVSGLVSALSGIGRSEMPLQAALPAAVMPAAVVPAAVVPAAAGVSSWPAQPLPYIPIFQTVTEKEEYLGRIARLEQVVHAQRAQLAAAKQQSESGDSSRPWPGKEEDADIDADKPYPEADIDADKPYPEADIDADKPYPEADIDADEPYSENVEAYSDTDYNETDQAQQTVDGEEQQQGEARGAEGLPAMQALDLGGSMADGSAAAGDSEDGGTVPVDAAGAGVPLQVDEPVPVGAN